MCLLWLQSICEQIANSIDHWRCSLGACIHNLCVANEPSDLSGSKKCYCCHTGHQNEEESFHPEQRNTTAKQNPCSIKHLKGKLQVKMSPEMDRRSYNLLPGSSHPSSFRETQRANCQQHQLPLLFYIQFHQMQCTLVNASQHPVCASASLFATQVGSSNKHNL